MKNILEAAQLISGLIVIFLVMTQPPADEMGGGGIKEAPVKRGWERITFLATIFFCLLFVLLSFLRITIFS